MGTDEPIFVPERPTKKFRPHFMVKFNGATLEWEFWKDDELRLAFSELALNFLVGDIGVKDHSRVEFIVEVYDKHLVLESVPLSRAHEYINKLHAKEEADGQGEQRQG